VTKHSAQIAKGADEGMLPTRRFDYPIEIIGKAAAALWPPQRHARCRWRHPHRAAGGWATSTKSILAVDDGRGQEF